MILTVSTRPNFLGGFDAVVRNQSETAVTTMGSFKTKNEAYVAATVLRSNLLAKFNIAVPRVFTFHADAAHGWLEVTSSDLDSVNLKPADFSQYSYVDLHCDAPRYFLEEDCDASKFAAAYKAKHGRDIETQEKHSHQSSFIRNLPRIK